MYYKKFIDEKIKLLSISDFILDVGGGERFTKWLKQYKEYFVGKNYKTLDFDSSTNPDIVGNIQEIPLEDCSVGGIICSSVLEHVNDPIKAVKEMYRVLRKDGCLFVYVPSIYPYHSREGHYPDMWRFFDDTILFLFKDFKSVEMCKFGGYFKAMSFFFPLQHKLQWLLDPAARLLDRVFKTDCKHTTAGYYVYAVK